MGRQTRPSPPGHVLPLADSRKRGTGRPLPTQASFWRRNRLTVLVLGAILVAAAGLRMFNLGQSPPGTLDDECVEIWNAQCLLKTGQDWHGVSWPILSTRGQGDNRPTIFMYCLIPFQAVFGMSVWSARFGAAVMGTVEVVLIFVVASRMFGRGAGLLAAAILALCPWHLRNSRYAFMANSFFITLPIALLLLANLPFQNSVKRRPRPVLALVAGAATGMCCYGYASVRIFLPLFLLAAVGVSWRSWWEMVRTRRGGLAIAGALVGLAATLGPLAWAHISQPERMAKRTGNIMIWGPGDSTGTKLRKAAARYLPHFGTDFLFEHGDGEQAVKPMRVVRSVPGTGAFQWYLLPAMAAGLASVGWKLRASHAARVLLAGVVLYPVADLFFQADGVHLYRSLPGLPVLVLLSAHGAAEAGRLLQTRGRAFFWPVVGAMGVWVALWSAPFLVRFYADYNRLPNYYNAFKCDLAEAFRYLRPRLDEADGVFVAMDQYGIHSVYLIAAVETDYDPRRWLQGDREVYRDAVGGDTDWVSRFGKVWFGASDYLRQLWRPKEPSAPRELPRLLYDLPGWRQLERDKPGGTAYLVVWPGYPAPPAPARVVERHEVRRPDGSAALWVWRVRI